MRTRFIQEKFLVHRAIGLIILLFAVGLTHTHAQNTWTQKSDFGGSARYGATGFSIGSKGYIGTGFTTTYKDDFWEYDPALNTWTQKANFGGTARFAAIGFSIDNKGYIGTGDDGSSTKDFWEYDPAANTWTKKASFGGSGRNWSTGFSIGDKGYIGLGTNSSGNKNDFWEYDPVNNSWVQKASFGGSARYGASGFSIGAKGYIGTGFDGTYKNDFWQYDPLNDLWTEKANLGEVGRYEAVGFCIGSKGYIGTGSDGTFKKDFWEFDPVINSWTQKTNFGGSARFRAIGFSIGGKGYIGTGFDNVNKKDLWEYTPEECFGLTLYADEDGDSYGDPANSYFAADCLVPDGYVYDSTDCNDNGSGIHPGVCDDSNGADDNCDGAIDDGAGAIIYYGDADSDGYGAGTGTYFCSNPGAGYSSNNTDCNDNNSGIHPGACDDINGVDDNCDGVMDDGSGAIIYYADEDGDGYGTGTGTPQCSNPGAGYSTNNTDCNDTNSGIHPGACDDTNGVDDNCDGVIDDGPGATTYYADADGDGYGVGSGISLCNNPGEGYSIYNTDCDDANVVVNPGAIEVINGEDDNCNGAIDESSIWIQKSDFGYNSLNVQEPTARFSATAFTVGNKGYIGTGYDGSYKKDFWEYDPAANTWTQKAEFGGSGRSSATGFSIGSKGYIGMGRDSSGAYKKDFWEYDPNANTWTQKTDFGGSARLNAIGFSIGSSGYIGTGYDINDAHKKDFWEYNPNANLWTQRADFGGLARSEATGFSIGTKGYIGTGLYYDSVTFIYTSYKDFWEYDPSADSWTQKADFGGTERAGATGFGIGNKGYIGTGFRIYIYYDWYSNYYYEYDYYKDFWEYNPVANTWTQKADFGGIARGDASGFSIGSKGYIGTGSGVTDFWEYDPDANTWTQKGDFGGTVREGAIGFSIGTKGYIGTGLSSTFLFSTYYKDFWEYDPGANSWTQKADFGGGVRFSASGFSIGSKGYIGTGSYASTYYKDFWEYDPDSNMWTQKADYGGSARINATGFSIGNKGYIGTGKLYPFGYKKDFWEYDPDANSWTQRADFAGSERYDAIGFSIGDKGYIGTGWNNGNFYKDFWEYDPNSNNWMQKEDFGGSARAAATGFSMAGMGYIGTGWDGSYKKDFWEYEPNANTWTKRANFGGSERYNATGFAIGNKGYIGTGLSGDYLSKIYFKDFWEYTPDQSIATCNIPNSLATDDISSTTATLQWDAVSGALGYRVKFKPAETSQWTFKYVTDNEITITGLTPNTKYGWKVRSVCSQSPVIYSDSSAEERFTTPPLRLGIVYESMFEVYPNPFLQSATVSFSLNEESSVVIEIMDVNGRSLKVIVKKDFSAGSHDVTFGRESLVAGIYFLQLKTNEEVMMKKMVIE